MNPLPIASNILAAAFSYVADFNAAYFFVVPVLLAIAAVILVSRQRAKRQQELSQLANETGFVYYKEPDPALAAELSEIRLVIGFSEQRARYRNILSGSRSDCTAVISDRTVGSGKSSSTTTIIGFKFATPLADFMVCRENLLWKFADKLGYKDIDVDAAPDFSQRYFLHGKDDAAVRALFTPDVIHAFEQLPSNVRLNVNGSGKWLIISQPGRTLTSAEILPFLQQAEVIASAFHRATKADVFGN